MVEVHCVRYEYNYPEPEPEPNQSLFSDTPLYLRCLGILQSLFRDTPLYLRLVHSARQPQ